MNLFANEKPGREIAVWGSLPEVLATRTIAFFGPGDTDNLAQQLLAALHNRQSPPILTHVHFLPAGMPDVVNDALDLFIDKPNVPWHSAGKKPWCDFAKAIA
ncbi:MAG: hypothetical protein ABIQ31_03795 [Ferruginibacter sp.]